MKNEILIIFLIIALICISLLLLGCSSNNGTYYQIVDGKIDENNTIIINGNKWEVPSQYGSGVKGDFTLDGDKITLYMDLVGQRIEYLSGTLSNGVLKLGIVGTEQIYYKDGIVPDTDSNQPGDGNKPSQQFVVSFNSLGGTFVNGMLANDNETINAPVNPTRDGYIFDGWYTNEHYDTKWNFTTDKVISNLILYAKWARQTYSVHFESNGGSEVNGIVDVQHDSIISEPANITKSGYVFAGWFKDSQCTEKWNFATDRVTSNVTLYAGWSVGLEYRLNADQAAYSVVGLSNSQTSNVALNILIPEIYNGKPVVAILQNAFCETDIESVSIPDSVVDIGIGAFSHCTNLTSVTLGNGVRNIASNAFFNCPQLTEITIPSGVRSIGDSAFYNCHIIMVNISDIASWCNIDFGNSSANPISVYSAKLFLNNNLIEDITFSDTVTEFKPYVFYSYYYLNNIKIPYSVTSIDEYAFANSSVKNVTVGNGVKTIGNYAFENCYQLSKVTLGSSLQKIGVAAFSQSRITSIIIPEGVVSIDNGAFSYCSLLTQISIPNSIESIAYSAFIESDNLQHNTYDNAKYLGNNSNPYVVLIESVTTSITELTVHKDSKIIMELAFHNCYSLTSVTIPDSVSSIGNSAFNDCQKLTSVYYEGDIASWCNISFGDSCANPLYNAHNLYIDNELVTELVIPDTVTEIKPSAFCNCTNIASVTIPDTVTSIGNWAFSNLETVYYKGDVDQWANISIGSYNNNLTSAMRYYFSETEPALNADGTAYDDNYWYYNDNHEAVVWEYNKENN